MTKRKLQELVRAVEERVAPPPAPRMQQVAPALPQAVCYDSVTRSAVIRRIRDLQRMYPLGWLVRQETFHVPALECLEDEELSCLLSDVERGRECLVEGVGFDEAGLVRSRADED